MVTIIYISGTRADFGLMRATLLKIRQCSDFQLKFIVTGMHLKNQHGYTIAEIEKDNFEIIRRIECYPEYDTTAEMSKSLGECIIGITSSLEEIKPDLVLLQGDRGEQLAAAIAAAHMNIPICHVSGGDVTGSIDDKIRNAISMFADIHCPATQFSADRLIGTLNIDEKDVHIVGEPGLDEIIQFEFVKREELYTKFKLKNNLPLFLIIQHAVTTEVYHAGSQMEETMSALEQFDANKIIIYPNSDAGGLEIIKVIEKYKERENYLILQNLVRNDFLNVMKHADVMIGNSSAGIVEAPSLLIPVINIGSRQDGRLQADNIVNVNYDASEISMAIERALKDKKFHEIVKKTENPYGKGNSSELIVSVLKEYLLND